MILYIFFKMLNNHYKFKMFYSCLIFYKIIIKYQFKLLQCLFIKLLLFLLFRHTPPIFYAICTFIAFTFIKNFYIFYINIQQINIYILLLHNFIATLHHFNWNLSSNHLAGIAAFQRRFISL